MPDQEDPAPAAEADFFEEVPLPEGFPESFPIPEDARIGESQGGGGREDFQIMLALPFNLDDSLALYRELLLAGGWEIVEDEEAEQGTYLLIRSSEFEGELYFVAGEGQAVVDISLYDWDRGQEELAEAAGLGEGNGPAQSWGDFPDDFPIPAGAKFIPLTDELAAEGYQLAFSYPDLPEMGLIQLSSSLMARGWEIGEVQLDGPAHIYQVPFSHPGSGFAGYALLTDNPEALGLESLSGSVIALHPGSLE